MRAVGPVLLCLAGCAPAGGVIFGGETSGTAGSTSIDGSSTGSGSTSGGASSTTGTGQPTSGGTTGTTDPSTTGSSTSGSTTGPGIDVGIPTTCAELVALQQPCDDQSMELGAVLGVGCPGVPGLDGPPVLSTHPDAWGLRETLGDMATWTATEGTQYLVLGSGFASNLDEPSGGGGTGGSSGSGSGGSGSSGTSGGSSGSGSGTGGNPPPALTCSDQLGPSYQKGAALPDPMTLEPSMGDCLAMPAAVGTGDCSQSLAPVLDPMDCGDFCINDYTEVRLSLTVPEHAVGLAFDVAFLTTEYPVYVDSIHDLFVAWLEAPGWTGNTTHDAMPRALSPASSFLTLVDDAPELEGTCIKDHGATPWLTTTFPVTPGEQIELVMAVLDNSDSSFDSFVLIDGVRWTCTAPVSPETTVL